MALKVFWLCVAAFFVFALREYPGNWTHYFFFTVVFNTLLFFGFRKRAIFFDAFIGTFLWLGFWLKLTVRVAFFGGQISDAGQFDGSGAAFDRALIISSCGGFGLLLASWIRGRWLFNYPAAMPLGSLQGLAELYGRKRRLVLAIFAIAIVAVTATNFVFGIYQRGLVSQTHLPFGLSGIFTWLLLFGLASFSAVVLHLELRTARTISYAAGALALIEVFLTNASLLSRGMILNGAALGYGTFRSARAFAGALGPRFWFVGSVVFVILFACSVVFVNAWRARIAPPPPSELAHQMPKGINRVTADAKPLFLDRWVGIEGVMAVSSYPAIGWDLWRQAWKEKPSRALSFYDSTFIASPYAASDRNQYAYISLPGLIAFFFYPGSVAFLFGCLIFAGLLAAAVEACVFWLTAGNLILCALLAQVVAARFAHFGYAPAQTYLLFGALFLNTLLIYVVDKTLALTQRR